mgnify:CR=1 FL=1
MEPSLVPHLGELLLIIWLAMPEQKCFVLAARENLLSSRDGPPRGLASEEVERMSLCHHKEDRQCKNIEDLDDANATGNYESM